MGTMIRDGFIYQISITYLHGDLREVYFITKDSTNDSSHIGWNMFQSHDDSCLKILKKPKTSPFQPNPAQPNEANNILENFVGFKFNFNSVLKQKYYF